MTILQFQVDNFKDSKTISEAANLEKRRREEKEREKGGERRERRN